jgi:hypothetical protein
MPHPTLQEIELTNLELHTTIEAVDDAPNLHPNSQLKLTRDTTPDSPLSIAWGEEINDRAVIREGRILRHDE